LQDKAISYDLLPRTVPREAIDSATALTVPVKSTHIRRKRRQAQGIDGDKFNDRDLYRKTGHNAIEKRYRTNLNDKIVALRNCIPELSVRSESKQGENDTDFVETGESAPKAGKAATLTTAIAYIKCLEESVERLCTETAGLKSRVLALEKVATTGSRGMSKSPP